MQAKSAITITLPKQSVAFLTNTYGDFDLDLGPYKCVPERIEVVKLLNFVKVFSYRSASFEVDLASNKREVFTTEVQATGTIIINGKILPQLIPKQNTSNFLPKIRIYFFTPNSNHEVCLTTNKCYRFLLSEDTYYPKEKIEQADISESE